MTLLTELARCLGLWLQETTELTFKEFIPLWPPQTVWFESAAYELDKKIYFKIFIFYNTGEIVPKSKVNST